MWVQITLQEHLLGVVGVGELHGRPRAGRCLPAMGAWLACRPRGQSPSLVSRSWWEDRVLNRRGTAATEAEDLGQTAVVALQFSAGAAEASVGLAQRDQAAAPLKRPQSR